MKAYELQGNFGIDSLTVTDAVHHATGVHVLPVRTSPTKCSIGAPLRTVCPEPNELNLPLIKFPTAPQLQALVPCRFQRSLIYSMFIFDEEGWMSMSWRN